jgi:hypothetical protein
MRAFWVHGSAPLEQKLQANGLGRGKKELVCMLLLTIQINRLPVLQAILKSISDLVDYFIVKRLDLWIASYNTHAMSLALQEKNLSFTLNVCSPSSKVFSRLRRKLRYR